MNADQILKALKSGKLSEQALRIVSRAVYIRYLEEPTFWEPFVEEINRINKPLREQIDDAIKELDV